MSQPIKQVFFFRILRWQKAEAGTRGWTSNFAGSTCNTDEWYQRWIISNFCWIYIYIYVFFFFIWFYSNNETYSDTDEWYGSILILMIYMVSIWLAIWLILIWLIFVFKSWSTAAMSRCGRSFALPGASQVAWFSQNSGVLLQHGRWYIFKSN